MIIVVFGMPGSGKSFFASRLADELRCAHVNSDQVRLRLFPVRTYSEDEKKKVYDEILKMAMQASLSNKDMVVDATFYKQAFREPYKKMSNCFFIEIKADEYLIKERLARPRTFSEADYSIYNKLKKEWEPFEGEHLVLESTNENIGNMLLEAKQYLGK